MADSAQRDRSAHPVRFPWSWTLPALLVIAATAAFGVRRYPHLPDELVLHYDSGGVPDRVVETTPLSAFSPMLTQVALTSLVFGLAALMLRARADVDVTDPARGGRQSRSSIMAMAQAVLNLAAFADLSAFFVALQLWGVWNSVGATATAVTASSAVGIMGLVFVAARASRSGLRQPTTDVSSTSLRLSDDDRYWRGLLYVNRDDPALMVPKRFGLGWTLNFGHPISWLIFGLLVSTPLVVSLLLAWLEH